MNSDRKPVDKRRIGPAMQWAKPQTGTDRSGEHRRNRINVDFEFETDWETDLAESASPNQYGSAESNEPRTGVTQSRAGTRSNESNSPSAAGTFQPHWNESSFSDEANEVTAWDYYSGNGSGAQYDGTPQGQNAPHFNDVGYEYPHQVESPNYNARSTEFNSTTDKRNNGPGIRQFLLPILAVAVVIIVGILASFG